MPSDKPVFLWRAETPPPPGSLKNGCLYCGSDLSRGSYVDPLTQKFLLDAQREQFGGNLLEVMSEEDWSPYAERAIAYNSTDYGGDHPMPETLDEAIDFFFGVDCNHQNLTCPRCGWWISWLSHQHGASVTGTAAAALLSFDLNSSQLALPELQSHLAKNYSDVYSLAPRRFEELLAAVYSQLGWQVTLTKQSRDGGHDLYCLHDDTGRVCLVECKRYAAQRKVGVFAVDRLLGVAFRNQASQAHFVTTSTFTKPAVDAACSARRTGFSLDLVDAHELSKLLGLYADPHTTVTDIELIYSSRRKITSQLGKEKP